MREAELVYDRIKREYTEGHVPLTYRETIVYVRGMKGAVSLGWTVPVSGDLDYYRSNPGLTFLLEPMARDLGYHRPTKEKPWEYSAGDCLILRGQCYGDGSSLNAQYPVSRYHEILAADGEREAEAWVRSFLAMEYHYRFYPEDHEQTPFAAQRMTTREALSRLLGDPTE